MSERLLVSDEVAAALAAKRPVVALETTVVTHGLPHPEGMKAALALEKEVRDAGAVPATIGVMGGRIRVGLSAAELETLATAPGVAKLNPGNFAAVLAAGEPGSTTVATTVFAARKAGIQVFATGGIGGVHRDVAESGDVSADLVAIARNAVAVVCAGAKAVLDLPRTVEMLEQLGVPVLGLGTDEFPAFYRRGSGLRVDRRMVSVDELAGAVRTHLSLGMGTGVVVANPIPEEDELPLQLYERSLAEALAAATAAGVQGRAVTPFLLERMRLLTGGESVRANMALLRNNARVGARLAAALLRAR